MAVPFLACMALVATLYHLPPRALPAIHEVEGGRVGSVHRNADGSDDLGPMQVNTRWITPLARLIGTTEDAVRAHLTTDACFNIAAAGAILRAELIAAHGDLMRAIGDYHSHTTALNLAYQARVLDAARRLFAGTGRRFATGSFQ